jgi:hypothetical protein
MPRKKRHKFKFDEESVNKLLQEIYEDSHNIRAKITRLFNKWESQAQEGGEIAALGDSIVKLINAEAKNQDQKIMLLKYLKEVVFAEKKEGSSQPDVDINEEQRNALLDIAQKAMNESNKK